MTSLGASAYQILYDISIKLRPSSANSATPTARSSARSSPKSSNHRHDCIIFDFSHIKAVHTLASTTTNNNQSCRTIKETKVHVVRRVANVDSKYTNSPLQIIAGNYDDNANYFPTGGAQGTDDSTPSSGAYGGSGVGQAGGYTGSQGRFNSGNNYAEADPGMAGNRGARDTQDINVPGAGRMRGEQEAGSYGQNIDSQGRSRGYERDNDEYGDYSAGQGQGAPKASLGSRVMGWYWLSPSCLHSSHVLCNRRRGEDGWKGCRKT